MGSGREVLTFQLGNYSNYVSSHWWNIQESYFEYDEKNPSEICHDVLFREGMTLKGITTFTPRTIIVDKKENSVLIPILDEYLHNSSKRNSTVLWDPNKVSSEVISTQEKHEFIQDLEKMDKGHKISTKDYNFEETVKSWCDFLKTRYHPKSLCLLNNEFHTEIYHSGSEIFSFYEEDLTEKIRSYLEECDNLQGFQILLDTVDAYGSIASNIALHLKDEYPNKTTLTLPLIPSYCHNTDSSSDIYKMINILLSYQQLSEHCDLVVPLSTNRTGWRGIGPPINFPHLTYNQKIFYQSSAIIASFLDTISLKYRLRTDFGLMRDITSGLNFWNRKICAASMSLPFPMSSDSYLLDTLENYDESVPLWSCLTPSCTIGNERIFYQRITIRGVPLERLRDPSSRRSSQAYNCTSVPELLHMYLSFYLNTISNVTSANTPLKTEIPFPKIFSRHISSNGFVDEDVIKKNEVDVLSCPVLAGLHSCKDIGRMLESLHISVKSINVRYFHHFVNMGMDLDEYKECLEKVLLLGNEYVSDIEL